MSKVFSLHQHGYTVFYNVPYLGNALEILKQRNIVFDRQFQQPIPSRNWRTREFCYQPGIHIYFMVGCTDVACFTPIMETLTVNDHPRRWAQEYLCEFTSEYETRH